MCPAPHARKRSHARPCKRSTVATVILSVRFTIGHIMCAGRAAGGSGAGGCTATGVRCDRSMGAGGGAYLGHGVGGGGALGDVSAVLFFPSFFPRIFA